MKKVTEKSFLALKNLLYLLEVTKSIMDSDLEVFIEISDVGFIELKFQGPYGYDELTFNIDYDGFYVEGDSYVDDPDKYKDMSGFNGVGEALEWFINWQRVRKYNYEAGVCINPYFYGV